jgi:P4 family phage/plasmid primase-like protien
MPDISRTLQLWCEDGQVYELRIPKTKKRGVISGYFDDLDALAVNADTLSDDVDVPAVYITLNPVIPDLIARSANETIDRSEVTTKDHEIARRRLLLVDCDPIRPVGISSSEAEHEAAIDRSRQIRDFLSSEGFPLSLLADSGNGAHNVYRIDLPNDQEAADLVKRFLESLAVRFGDAVVAVDTSVWNASRICKLYGTMTRKGSNHPSRPWRKSTILDCPETLEVVPVELLRKIANPPIIVTAPIIPPKKTRTMTPGKNTATDVEKMMADKGLKFSKPTPYEDGVRWVLEECPWHEEHSDGPGGSAIFLRNGIIGFDCKHAHCQERTIRDVLGAVNGGGGHQVDGGKKDPKKFDKMAQAFVEHHVAQGHHLLYTSGRTYLYAGCRYTECDELPMKVREFFKVNGWSQSNNVVGNVVPIVQSYAWKDVSRYGPMPFWIGDKRPFTTMKNVIAFSNGLLDLEAPANLIPHSPNWCSTVCLPFGYDPLAMCPTWEKFLSEVFEGDQDRVALIQEFFGYCLSSDTSLQKALILVGKPRSGKGTIQRVLGALVGPDNSTGFSLERLATEFGPSALVNKSVALVGEVELSANPQRMKIVEVLKSIIGEDAISINTKYESTFPSLRLPIRFVIASNSVPRLLDASGALAHRFLFVPFEISFVGREDTHLEDKLLKELPGIANWALAGLKRLRAAVGRFTLGDGHKRLASQYAADTSPIMAWVRSEMVVHCRADPGDLPPECLTRESVSIGKSDAYDLYCAWCESHDIEPTRPAWFGRDLKTLIPKLQEGRDTKPDGARVHVYRGIGIRPTNSVDHKPGIESECTALQTALTPSQNGVAELSLSGQSGQSGHLDCFLQLLNKIDNDKEKEKVVENNENARTARTQPPSHDSEGEKRADSLREARRLSHSLRLEYCNGYVVQPDTKNLSIWRVGKDVGGAVRWLEQHGSREWAVGEVERRLGPKPTPPPVQNEDEDHTADVLNTLICNIDEGKFDLTEPDDREILECQIASALDNPEVADMAESLLLDLDNGGLTLDDVRQRADEMLAVLLELEEELTEEEARKWLEENLV